MFYDLFEKLCKERKIKPTPAAIAIGFSKSTASKWKKTEATPDGESLKRIAAYFNVSVNDLLEDKKLPVILSDDGQREYDAIFKQLSPDNQTKWLELGRLYLASQHNTENNT